MSINDKGSQTSVTMGNTSFIHRGINISVSNTV